MARKNAVDAVKAEADRYAANVFPIIPRPKRLARGPSGDCGSTQRPRDRHGTRGPVVRAIGRKHPGASIVKGSSRGGDARAVGVRDRRVLHNVTRRCSSRSLLSCQARQALSFHDRRRCPSPGEYLRFRAIHSHGQIECSFRRGKPVRLLVPSGTFVLEVDIK